MNKFFTVKKNQYLSKNKFVQGVSPGKKIPAQAVREKKNSYQLKIPHTPHHFSNGPSLRVVNSGSSGPGSGPGRGHCVVFVGKTLYSHSASLHPSV